MAYSNLQKQILRLYRDIVRNCVLGNPKKTDLLDYARSEFKKNLKISKRDFDTIEFHYNKGRNLFLTLKDSNLVGVNKI